MAQANSDFIPAFSSKTFHMRQLLKKNTPYQWDQKHEKEFLNLKSSLYESTILSYFDPKKESVVYFDGHTLCQIDGQGHQKVVAYASRSTTLAEQKYPQIDIEAAAFDFACH